MARIFVMVQPEGVEDSDAILAAFDRIGRREQTVYVSRVPVDALHLLYTDHKSRPYFDPMVSDIVGKPAVVAVYEGRFKDFRQVKDLVRNRFVVPSHADYIRSPVHCSETGKESRRDVSAWKSYLR